MRKALFFGSILLANIAWGQQYPFEKDFTKAVITLKDSTQKTGFIKWIPQLNETLKFRETQNGETIKYTPDSVEAFTVDTFRYVTLHNIDVYAENYGILNKTSTVKHIFAQVIDKGKFNIYFVLDVGYNPLNGYLRTYPNFLFQNAQDTSLPMVAYPFEVRMTQKKYDRAKEKLINFFKDYPQIVEKIKNYRKGTDFYDIINMVKADNHL